MALAADPIEPDYTQPPSWWPKEPEYRFPPQKEKPDGWSGKWPGEKDQAHNPVFWAKYYQLTGKAPKRYGKRADPAFPFHDGFSGDFSFTRAIAPSNRQLGCTAYRFTGTVSELVSGICTPGLGYALKEVAEVCKKVADDPRAKAVCERICASKRRGAIDNTSCKAELVKPPLFVDWRCTDKEAGALVACSATHMCNCR